MISNKQIILTGLLLFPKQLKSKLYVFHASQVVSTSKTLHFPRFASTNNTPSDSCSMFMFKSLPDNHHDLVITGMEAVNFVLLKDKLEKALGSLASENIKIRIVFGVVNFHPIDTLNPKSFLEAFSIIKDALVEIFRFVPYHKEGIEFRFGSDAVHILVKMINEVISDQGKDPENIHI